MFLVAALAAGCGSGGGGSAKLAASDIAVVGSQHITKAQFDTLMSQAKSNLKAQGRTFPKAGTTDFASLKSQAVSLLVQNAEKEASATKLGISVTPKDIESRLNQIKKQYFGGKNAKYEASLKQQGLTDTEVRDNIKSQLVSQKLFDKLTKDVSVSPTAILAYYTQNSSQYKKGVSRDVRYILVGKNKSSLTSSLSQQLKGASNATWCTLVKKYSGDKGSKSSCGKATFTKGQTVREFDKLAFSLATNAVAKVNTKQYGWFVLQPTAPIAPAKTIPVAQVSKQIEQQLLQDKKNALMTTWIGGIQKTYCKGGKITFQVGYTPSSDPCAPTNTTTT